MRIHNKKICRRVSRNLCVGGRSGDGIAAVFKAAVQIAGPASLLRTRAVSVGCKSLFRLDRAGALVKHHLTQPNSVWYTLPDNVCSMCLGRISAWLLEVYESRVDSERYEHICFLCEDCTLCERCTIKVPRTILEEQKVLNLWRAHIDGNVKAPMDIPHHLRLCSLCVDEVDPKRKVGHWTPDHLQIVERDASVTFYFEWPTESSGYTRVRSGSSLARVFYRQVLKSWHNLAQTVAGVATAAFSAPNTI